MQIENTNISITGNNESDLGNLIIAYLGIISYISYFCCFLYTKINIYKLNIKNY